MKLVRTLVPTTPIFYLFFAFLTLIFVFLILWAYYHLGKIEHFFGGTNISFLDLQQKGNLLDWFYSFLWIHTGVFSILILDSLYEKFAKTNQTDKISKKERRIAIFFWWSLTLISFLMSAETICSFSDCLFNIFSQSDKEGKTIQISIMFWRFIIVLFAFIEFWFLFQFIKEREHCRLSIFCSACVCFLSFILVFVFCINNSPNLSNVAANSAVSSEKDREFPSKEKVPDKAASETKSSDKKENKKEEKKPAQQQEEENPDENNDSSSNFHFASQEKETELTKSDDDNNVQSSENSSVNSMESEKNSASTDNSQMTESSSGSTDSDTTSESDTSTGSEQTDSTKIPALEDQKSEKIDKNEKNLSKITAEKVGLSDNKKKEFHWEAVFGWSQTLEENLGLERDIEEYCGFSQKIETWLWNDEKPDFIKIQEALRYGSVGFFLVMLALTVQLVIRAGRVAYEIQLKEELEKLKRTAFVSIK